MLSPKEIESTTEILSILRQLARTRALISVSFNQGKGSISTLLLDVDEKRGILIFDVTNDPSVNAKIAASLKITFQGTLNGSKLLFTSTGVKPIQHQGSSAMSARLPTLMSHHQRRESYRVNISGATCSFHTPATGTIKLNIVELSVGGVQLVLNIPSDSFSINQRIATCMINLGTDGNVSCGLEIRSIKQLPNKKWTLGCQLLGLSKTGEAQIARFVTRAQGKINASSGRFFGL